MKPLGDRQKRFAERYLLRGPLRPLAKAAYHCLLATEIAAARLLTRPDPADTSRVTAVIKTFERPASCSRLIASIRRRYRDLAILVVDDSREAGRFAGVRTLRLPYDSGLSAGRNAGVAAAATPYVLILDDDFLFDRKTDLKGAIAILDAHPEIDLLAGEIIDFPLRVRHRYDTASLLSPRATPKIAPGTGIGPALVMDKVPNFFIARREALIEIGWDEQLTLLEHADFFTRARGRIVSAMWSGWRIAHCRDPFDRDYLAFRQRLDRPAAHLARKYANSAASDGTDEKESP